MRAIELFEKRQPEIVFHGTNKKYLRDILKKGMLPDVSLSNYDDEGTEYQRRLSKVGGSYWAKDYGTARAAGFRSLRNTDDLIVIIAQIHNHAALADEDTVANIIYQFNKHVEGTELYDNKRLKAFVNWAHDYLTSAIPKTKIPKNIPLLTAFYNSDQNRRRSYYSNDTAKQKKAEDEFQHILDQMTRYYKQSIYTPSHDDWQPLRYDRPITYRGNVKILGIIEEDRNTSKYDGLSGRQQITMKIVYGTVPPEAIRKISKFFEKDFHIVGNQLTTMPKASLLMITNQPE